MSRDWKACGREVRSCARKIEVEPLNGAFVVRYLKREILLTRKAFMQFTVGYAEDPK